MFDLPVVLIGFQKPSVETLSIFSFLENSNTRYGPAAAYAFVLFVYVAIVAYLFVKFLGADLLGDKAAPKVSRRQRRAAEKQAEKEAVAA